MLYQKILIEQLLSEDSLASAYASLKYADRMLANAQEKNLHSKNYWNEKKINATERINTLKSKGEQETEDTHKQADEILFNLERKNKVGFKELLKNPEIKKNAINFTKEIASHTTLKAIITHTSHHFHNLIKPVINTSKGLFTKPKETISNLKNTSKQYFKTIFKAAKNTKVIADNANKAFSDIHKKYSTKFTPEEKKELMHDPDKFLSKLSNKLTTDEISDIKMVTRHALNVATAALCAQYISHVTHGITEISHALTKGVTDASIEICKEVGKEHLLGSIKESFINTSIMALDLAGNTAHLSESLQVESETDYTALFSSMTPFIQMYNKNPEIQKNIIELIGKSMS